MHGEALAPVRQLDGDDIAGPDTQPGQPGGQPHALVEQLGSGELIGTVVAVHHDRRVGVLADEPGDLVGDGVRGCPCAAAGFGQHDNSTHPAIGPPPAEATATSGRLDTAVSVASPRSCWHASYSTQYPCIRPAES